MVNGNVIPKVFFTLSENDEDVACFSVTPAIMVLSVGDLLVATISVEMSDSSEISSRSSVPVEVAKSWPCSTGVDSLASLLSPPSGPCISWFSFMVWSGWTSTSSIVFALLKTFDFWFQPFCLKPSPLFAPGSCAPFHKRVGHCSSLFLRYEFPGAIT